jgi:K+-transporting ATPase ATPase C chain
MWQPMRTALLLFAVVTLLTGVVYPLAVTGLAQVLFPWQVNGSLIEINNEKTASELVGQPFSEPQYFWGRPSATAPVAYNGASSTGSNRGPSNPALQEAVRKRIAALRSADPENRLPIPVDLVTASGSGLDPHISPDTHPGEAIRDFWGTHRECSAPEHGPGGPALSLLQYGEPSHPNHCGTSKPWK